MENVLIVNIMKKMFLILSFLLGVLTFVGQPVLAASHGTAIEQQDKKKDDKKKNQTVTFKTSIHCKNCVKKMNDNLAFEKGVKDLKVSLDEKLVTITYDPAKTDETALAKAIEKLGYTAEKIEPITE